MVYNYNFGIYEIEVRELLWVLSEFGFYDEFEVSLWESFKGKIK